MANAGGERMVLRSCAGMLVRATVSIGIASLFGCGAAPGYDEGTTPPAQTADLRALEIAQPTAQLRGTDGTHATIDIQVVVTNPNAVPVTMRRATGEILLGGVQAARIEVEGDDIVDPDAERAFVFDIRVPLALLTQVQADEYLARGTLYADGGDGNGGLESPFEFTGAVPR